jgi:hypothetical protein
LKIIAAKVNNHFQFSIKKMILHIEAAFVCHIELHLPKVCKLRKSIFIGYGFYPGAIYILNIPELRCACTGLSTLDAFRRQPVMHKYVSCVTSVITGGTTPGKDPYTVYCLKGRTGTVLRASSPACNVGFSREVPTFRCRDFFDAA